MELETNNNENDQFQYKSIEDLLKEIPEHYHGKVREAINVGIESTIRKIASGVACRDTEIIDGLFYFDLRLDSGTLWGNGYGRNRDYGEERELSIFDFFGKLQIPTKTQAIELLSRVHFQNQLGHYWGYSLGRNHIKWPYGAFKFWVDEKADISGDPWNKCPEHNGTLDKNKYNLCQECIRQNLAPSLMNDFCYFENGNVDLKHLKFGKDCVLRYRGLGYDIKCIPVRKLYPWEIEKRHKFTI